MRSWYKYEFTTDISSCRGDRFIQTARQLSYLDDIQTRIGINEPLSFQSQAHLKKVISKNDKVLSIGSGVAPAEVMLLRQGYDITMSDIHESPIRTMRKNFPKYKYIKLDILSPGFLDHYADLLGKFDAVFIPSIFYLFDDDQCEEAISNIKALIKPGGKVCLTFRSRDSKLINYLDNYFIPFDRWLSLFWHRVRANWRVKLCKIHHGYRRTLDEFIICFAQEGFNLLKKEYSIMDLEIRRLEFIWKLLSKVGLEKVLTRLSGNRLPYINFLVFQKPEPILEELPSQKSAN